MLGERFTFLNKDFAHLAKNLQALLNASDRLAEIVSRQRERAAALTRGAAVRTSGIYWSLVRNRVQLFASELGGGAHALHNV